MPACPVCSTPLGRRCLQGRDRMFGLPGEFWVRTCDGCGLAVTGPALEGKDLERHYPDQYAAFQPRGRRRGLGLLRWLRRRQHDLQLSLPPLRARGALRRAGAGRGLWPWRPAGRLHPPRLAGVRGGPLPPGRSRCCGGWGHRPRGHARHRLLARRELRPPALSPLPGARARSAGRDEEGSSPAAARRVGVRGRSRLGVVAAPGVPLALVPPRPAPPPPALRRARPSRAGGASRAPPDHDAVDHHSRRPSGQPSAGGVRALRARRPAPEDGPAGRAGDVSPQRFWSGASLAETAWRWWRGRP